MLKTRPVVVHYDRILTLDISLDTPEWFQWLATQSTFSYSGHKTEMNCVKRNNGKWYANKKIFSAEIGRSRTVSLYIGNDGACTLDKLSDINENFGLEWQRFWHWYYSPERTSQSRNDSLIAEEDTLDEQQVLQADEEIAELHLALETKSSEPRLLQKALHEIEYLKDVIEELKAHPSALELLDLFLAEHRDLREKMENPKRYRDCTQLAKFKGWLEVRTRT